jgi:hypothetical protein
MSFNIVSRKRYGFLRLLNRHVGWGHPVLGNRARMRPALQVESAHRVISR